MYAEQTVDLFPIACNYKDRETLRGTQRVKKVKIKPSFVKVGFIAGFNFFQWLLPPAGLHPIQTRASKA